MDLSKAFDCISHDLIIAKLAACGIDDTALKLIFFYLKNQKQRVRINNVYSNFENIITGVPQGSIFGPLLFDFSTNNLFFFMEFSSIHNFADDNTLSAWANIILDLINKLESDSNTENLKIEKIENLQKRALRFLYDYFEASYKDLLSEGGKSQMRTLCVEIHKTLNDLNTSFMNNIFKLKKMPERFVINTSNHRTFGYKSLKVLGPKICNNLP